MRLLFLLHPDLFNSLSLSLSLCLSVFLLSLHFSLNTTHSFKLTCGICNVWQHPLYSIVRCYLIPFPLELFQNVRSRYVAGHQLCSRGSSVET